MNSPSASVAERALLARAKSGEADAFEEVVRLHAGRIYALLAHVVANRADAEEVAQETFLRAWRALPRFRGEARFSTWLFRIAMNEANRRFAFEARCSALPLDDVTLDVPDLSDGPAGLVEATEVRDLLERALLELPPHYRIAVVLRDVGGLTNEEATEVLGLDLRNVKSRLHRGRMALRRRLRTGGETRVASLALIALCAAAPIRPLAAAALVLAAGTVGLWALVTDVVDAGQGGQPLSGVPGSVLQGGMGADRAEEVAPHLSGVDDPTCPRGAG